MPTLRKGLQAFFQALNLSTLVPFLLVALPLYFVFSRWPQADLELWAHIKSYVLYPSIWETLAFVGVAVAVATVLGCLLALFLCFYEFPGRRFFEYAVFLPLAIPAYVYAFLGLGFLEASGPLQSLLREWGILSGFYNPRHLVLGAALLGLSLSPYVYMVSRLAFLKQGARLLEASRSLGLGLWASVWKVLLPASRRWILGGALLAAMEALADFGVASLFNVRTLSTTVYSTWYGHYSLETATRVALPLLGLAVLLLMLRHSSWLLGKKERSLGATQSAMRRVQLGSKGFGRLLCVLFSFYFIFSVIGPIGQLLLWAFLDSGSLFWQPAEIKALLQSLFVALTAGLMLVLMASTAVYSNSPRNKVSQTLLRLSTLGYAIPGAVLAIGYQLSVLSLNAALSGSLIVMLFAYCSRYFAVAFEPISAHYTAQNRSLTEVAQTLGLGSLSRLRRLHWPVMRPALFTALLFASVDILKELPMTLMTRPFGFETLAIRVHRFASEGEWSAAAVPALYLLLAGMLPVWILIKESRRVEE